MTARFADQLLRPFVVLAVLAVTAVQLVTSPTLPLVTALFVPVAAGLVGGLFSWDRLTPRQCVAVAAAVVVLAAVMFPLAPSAGTALPFLASALAGDKIPARGPAVTVAVTGAVVCALAVWASGALDPAASTDWPWWMALTVGLPVTIGIGRRDREAALATAECAAAEATRAMASEAREAALIERSRIAREIHDVLGHSLSGIALQLATADALHVSGRDDEANEAVHRARALTVASINETRRAVHALRSDTLPLPETLRLLAEAERVAFTVVGEAGPVAIESAQTVVRVAQEALTNATKYAPGADREITLTFDPEQIRLNVHNGPADPRSTEPVLGTGMGLVGMRERAALLGGMLRAAPDVTGGWTVDLRVPRTMSKETL